MKKYDAIVIGAGHNGLTNAAFLAKAGLNVVVVEKNDYIGGASVSRNIHDDWTYSNCSYVCSLFRPEIYRNLELGKHGLQIINIGGGATLMENGDFLGSYEDHEVSRRELIRHSPRDADAYDRFSTDMAKWCRFIRPFLLRTPADPTSFRPRDIQELIYLGRKFYDLGQKDLHHFLRFFTASISDYLDQYFESDVLKASLAGSGIIGTGLGPMSPGTAYVLLHHYMGDMDGSVGSWGFARGGMGSIANALAGSLKEHGGEIRTGQGVEQIIVKNGKATGVALENGDEIHANIVVSNLDAKRTFLGIMDPKDAGEKVVKAAKNFKSRGSSGKVNIALNGAPRFDALPQGSDLVNGFIHVTDSIERMERAYDDWKAGTWSKDPYLDMLVPTYADPTMAPPGKHFMSVFVQYCPSKLTAAEHNGEDWTDKTVTAFGETVLNQISKYSTNFRDLVEHVEVRTPREIEAEIGLTDGNIFQGELTMDQLMFNRPFPGYAQYRGPVKGMYMCGSSTHPGGGVMAAPGANAAREILLDLKRPNTVPEDEGDD
ncbi:MAG: NAD(P)/FAD-dependent oxidoreductase [Alteromonadaceae bacterium]|nr:NAD(P)/FAD-dependent oxidoreductase [Alteromonadaceae bacterium]